MARAPEIHHAARYPYQIANVRGVFQARNRRLRRQISAAFGQSAAGHLEGRVVAEIVEIVAIGVTACDREDTATEDIGHRMGDLHRIARIREQPGQSVDQAKTLVGGGQKEHAAVRTDLSAVECGGNFLLTDVWQRERQKSIVINGGHGRFCPGLESGVDTQSLSDSRRLDHARLRISAMQ